MQGLEYAGEKIAVGLLNAPLHLALEEEKITPPNFLPDDVIVVLVFVAVAAAAAAVVVAAAVATFDGGFLRLLLLGIFIAKVEAIFLLSKGAQKLRGEKEGIGGTVF